LRGVECRRADSLAFIQNNVIFKIKRDGENNIRIYRRRRK